MFVVLLDDLITHFYFGLVMFSFDLVVNELGKAYDRRLNYDSRVVLVDSSPEQSQQIGLTKKNNCVCNGMVPQRSWIQKVF